MELSKRVRNVRPWPGGDDMGDAEFWDAAAYGPRNPGLREMHLESVAAAFEAADRIAREESALFDTLAGEIRGVPYEDRAGKPLSEGCMGQLRLLASEATVIASLLDPPRGHHWGIEMPEAMNANIGDPATMLRKMGCDPGRTGEECDALEHAAEAVPLALRMAGHMAQVFATLVAMGPGIVAHFLDDDDNDGEFLRRDAEAWRGRYL